MRHPPSGAEWHAPRTLRLSVERCESILPDVSVARDYRNEAELTYMFIYETTEDTLKITCLAIGYE
jgi:hypothetical protein